MRIVLGYPTEEYHRRQIAAAAGERGAASDSVQIVAPEQEDLARQLLEADIFCGHAKVPVPWAEVVRGGRLKWIQSSAAGLDHCLTPEVIESDISVTSASGLFSDQVAEQAMALLLGLVRRLPTFFRAQQARQFVRRPTDDLHGKTVGIVGLGGNGRRIADVLAPWRVRILATDMFPDDKPAHVEALWPADRLDDLLGASDIVVLCVPLTEFTRGMINARTLETMKPGALLVNVARGPVVVEADLVAALAGGHLGGAGLDVTEQEPPSPDSLLWERADVLLTPHVGAQSASRYSTVTDFFCDNLGRYLGGLPLANLVDKRLGYPTG